MSPRPPPPDAGNAGDVTTLSLQLDLPSEGLALEHGGHLREVTVAYETYGERVPAGNNVVFICHALTGDAHVAGRHPGPDGELGWWDDMIGPGKGIDTRYYHVVCANILGGCKGTTGPASIDPETGRPYGSRFPRVSVSDIVDVHVRLLRQLGITRVATIVGGSFGGMQVLDWIIRYADRVDQAVCIASATSLSAQALAFDTVGRDVITADPAWNEGDYYDTGLIPERGLSQARKLGHITYLSPFMMEQKFGREKHAVTQGEATPPQRRFRTDFQVESYLDHQGDKFIKRFDANAYLHITEAMDAFDLADHYGSLAEALAPIQAKVLVVALSEDWLFPVEQSRLLANALLAAGKRVSYCELHAPHGHDAFLVDIRHLSEAMRAFLPWIATGEAQPPNRTAAAPDTEPRERVIAFHAVERMIAPGARVLDLGCGSGDLLAHLAGTRSITGIGIDIDIGHIIRVIDHGFDVFQRNIDGGLSMVPDNCYDYAVLNETLQVVHRPRQVLQEMLRVAREGIVSFPNFGNLSHRLQLLLKGRMPVGGALPFTWYDTPNIHHLTLLDFLALCRQDNIAIRDLVCIPTGALGRLLLALGLRNLGADRILVKLARKANHGIPDHT